MTDASAIIDYLSEKVWTKGAHAWFTEVNAATGGRACRRADALVVSCWPSRGIYAFGIEVKVDRHDWLKELRDVTKSASIQKFCRQWWVATTPGIVRAGELPETWGLIEVEPGKRSHIVTTAPKLEAEPPTWEFFASVFRNASKALEERLYAVVANAQRTDRQRIEEMHAKLFEFERADRSIERMRDERDNAINALKEYSERTGINPNAWGESQRVQRVLKLAATIEELSLESEQATLERAGKKLLKAAELMRSVKLEGTK